MESQWMILTSEKWMTRLSDYTRRWMPCRSNYLTNAYNESVNAKKKRNTADKRKKSALPALPKRKPRRNVKKKTNARQLQEKFHKPIPFALSTALERRSMHSLPISLGMSFNVCVPNSTFVTTNSSTLLTKRTKTVCWDLWIAFWTKPSLSRKSVSTRNAPWCSKRSITSVTLSGRTARPKNGSTVKSNTTSWQATTRQPKKWLSSSPATTCRKSLVITVVESVTATLIVKGWIHISQLLCRFMTLSTGRNVSMRSTRREKVSPQAMRGQSTSMPSPSLPTGG
eukprot:PhF_6_TR10035/c1_g1_i1/m.15408